MRSMSLEQLRATISAGGVTGVTLSRAVGASSPKSPPAAAKMPKARTTESRHFGNPTSALIVLRDMSIAIVQLDATHWNSDQKGMTRSRQSRAEAMRGAHEAAAYNQWLITDQDTIDDPHGRACRTMKLLWPEWMPVLHATRPQERSERESR